jgi:hypothetical protein
MLLFIFREPHLLLAEFAFDDTCWTILIEVGFSIFFLEFFMAFRNMANQFNEFAIFREVIFKSSR